MGQPEHYDFVIAGAGLAGTAAAVRLSQNYRVLLLDGGSVGGGATGVGAGIASPILARKGNPTYEAREALDALDELAAEVGLAIDRSRPLIRPAFGETQVEYYQRAAALHPDLASWCSREELAERFTELVCPLGGLEVTRGYVVNLSAFASAMASAASTRGATVHENTTLESWTDEATAVVVHLKGANGLSHSISTSRLLLALGSGYARMPALDGLNLHPVKGQTIRAPRPAELNGLPNITGPGYLAHDGEEIILGSTFVHDSLDRTTTNAATDEILDLIRPSVPGIGAVSGFEARAGVRVTVPGTRLPMIGPLDDRRNVWIFTGLGSKGLLMAPLLTRRLDEYLHHPERIPAAMSVQDRPQA